MLASKTYKSKAWGYYVLMLGLTLFSVVTLIPFLWMISASLRTDIDIFRNPMNWIPEPIYFENYKQVWSIIPFSRYILNTIKLTLTITVLQVLVSAMSGYAFAKLKVPFKNSIFMIFIASMMMPWQSIMVPQFTVISHLGLYNTHTGYVLTQLFSAFGIFLMRQFFMSLPDELNEAARIDGCNEWRIFWRIMMPLALPGLSTLVIFTFVYMWNDYLAPLIYLNSDALKTIQLGLQAFKSQYTMDYGLLMAGTAIATIPMVLIFLLGERFFIQGIATTGMKN